MSEIDVNEIKDVILEGPSRLEVISMENTLKRARYSIDNHLDSKVDVFFITDQFGELNIKATLVYQYSDPGLEELWYFEGYIEDQLLLSGERTIVRAKYKPDTQLGQIILFINAKLRISKA